MHWELISKLKKGLIDKYGHLFTRNQIEISLWAGPRAQENTLRWIHLFIALFSAGIGFIILLKKTTSDFKKNTEEVFCKKMVVLA